jgi:hypothetical protein
MQVLLIWAVLVLGGFGYLVHYTATAGVGDRGASDWPSGADVMRKGGVATLLVFMHPACPCSRATVVELARLLARVGPKVETVAMFVRPERFEEGWERTELWESAARIPGVRCVVDPGGNEARRFGAATSGYTLLYNAEGTLVFHGGITAARGHEGDNEGENAVLSWFRSGRAEPAETPAFGCPLFGE